MDNIKQYIARQGYSCREGLVENFCLSLMVRPFVVLTGMSSTDMTLLPRLVAEAMGATEENGRYKSLKVEYDWMDSSDLFGHLDLWGNFVPGAVLEFLVQARNDPQRPYFLCFDKLILARAEYYLREILQTACCLGAGEDAPELVPAIYYGRDEKALEKYGVVPALKNLYIVATLALDETGFPLNQKFMDQVYTLQVEKEDAARTGEAAPLPCAGYTNAFLQTPLRSIEQWGQYEEKVDGYLALLEQLNKILMQANAYVGYQIRNDIVTYLLNNHRCGFLPESEAIDHLITRKVLVRAQGNARTVTPVLEQLLRLCAGQYPQAEKKLLKMLEQCEKEDYTGYWI